MKLRHPDNTEETFMKQLSALEKKSLGKPLTDPPAVTRVKMLLRSYLLVDNQDLMHFRFEVRVALFAVPEQL